MEGEDELPHSDSFKNSFWVVRVTSEVFSDDPDSSLKVSECVSSGAPVWLRGVSVSTALKFLVHR
jgi:hypothetical protein